MSDNQKYIRFGPYNEFIIFPSTVQHSAFKHLKPVSAGFCSFHVEKGRVDCFGRSISLRIASKQEDSKLLTRQVYGAWSAIEHFKD